MNIITESEFRKRLKTDCTGGFLFYGSEDYMKSFALKLARETVCPDEALAPFNNIRLEGLELTPDSLLGALTTLPMMSERKLIEITHLDLKDLKSSELDEYCSIFALLAEYDYNTLIVSIPSNQLELKYFIEDCVRNHGCQFIISTHSPFLLSLKGAKIYDIDSEPVRIRKWTELECVKVYREFFRENEFKF